MKISASSSSIHLFLLLLLICQECTALINRQRLGPLHHQSSPQLRHQQNQQHHPPKHHQQQPYQQPYQQHHSLSSHLSSATSFIEVQNQAQYGNNLPDPSSLLATPYPPPPLTASSTSAPPAYPAIYAQAEAHTAALLQASSQTTVRDTGSKYPDLNLDFSSQVPVPGEGTRAGGVRWLQGEKPHDGMLTLAGNPDCYLDLGTVYFSATGAMTMRFWVRFEDDSLKQSLTRIFDCGNGAMKENVILYRDTNPANLGLMIVGNNDKETSYVIASSVLQSGVWMDIAATINQKYAALFVDGERVAAGVVRPVARKARNGCYIGRSNFDKGPMLKAKIDSIQMWWSTALIDEDISNMHLADLKTPCEINNGGCDLMTQCRPNPNNAYEAPTCSACPAGFMSVYDKSGKHMCQDVDECNSGGNGGCDPRTRCINTPGSRACGPCPKGWYGKGEVACLDVDECLESNGGCDLLSRCQNTPGSRICGPCPSGYQGMGDIRCTDVDECILNNGGCDQLAECINTIGSRQCAHCPRGYEGDGLKCRDIDECRIANGGCDTRTLCINIPGSRKCGACPKGYTGDGAEGCSDVDECTYANGGCDPFTRCLNIEGSRRCAPCPVGYSGSGESGCNDIDECSVNNGGCHVLSDCKNTPGSRICGACPRGYTGNGLVGCVDIDECVTNNGGCDILTECINEPCGRKCGPCPDYYKGDGKSGCVALNMCKMLDNGGCDPLTECQPNARAEGGRTCGNCPPGLIGDGYTGCKQDTRFVKLFTAESQAQALRRYELVKTELQEGSLAAGMLTAALQGTNNQDSPLQPNVADQKLINGAITYEQTAGTTQVKSTAAQAAADAVDKTTGVTKAALLEAFKDASIAEAFQANAASAIKSIQNALTK